MPLIQAEILGFSIKTLKGVRTGEFCYERPSTIGVYPL